MDRPDDVQGFQVHVMYVLPSDGVDEGLDTNGTIAASATAFNDWFAGQTGAQRLRVDTCGGSIDVTFARLNQTDAAIASTGAFVRDTIEAELSAAGVVQPFKIYAVYYGGTSQYSCGGGAWPPALMGRVAAVYLGGLPAGAITCRSVVFLPGGQPGYLEFAMLHEIIHTLGYVATCAPHHVRNGHVSDSRQDLMWAGDEAWLLPPTLDVGHDDYWATGSAGCLDLVSSAFLDPSASNAAPPPGWNPVPPTAQTASLAAWQPSTLIPLNWGATAGWGTITGYDIRYRRAKWNGSFGSNNTWRSGIPSISATFAGSAGYTYCFSARAHDSLGSVSAWTTATCTAIPLDDRSMSRFGRWIAGTGSAFYKSTYARSFTAGSKLVRTQIVARRIAILATTCATCGKIRVFWGSSLLKSINLYSATTVNRRLIPVVTFTRARIGTLTIKVYSSGRRVTIDGVAIRRN